MRKLAFIMTSIIALGLAGYFILPKVFFRFLEYKITADCLQSISDETCVNRMRGMGNSWSATGDLVRAEQ